MTKNLVIKDKELLKFIDKAKAIIQTSLQQELMADLRKTSKFKTTKHVIGGSKKNSVGAVVKNYLDKNYSKAGAKSLKIKLSKRNVITQMATVNKPVFFGYNSRVLNRNVLSTSTITRTNTATSILKSKYDIYNSNSVLKQIDLKKEFKNINLKSIIDISKLQSILRESAFLNFDAAKSSSSAPTNKKLKFKLHEVKCIKKNEFRDEIAAGGSATDYKGDSSPINEFFVDNGFKDGKVKRFSPARTVATFPLNADNIYPKAFAVNLFLVEKDLGGFSSFLTELNEAIEDELKLVLMGLGALAGAAITAGTLGTALGALIGVSSAFIIDAVIDLVAGYLQDDMFTCGNDYAGIDIDSNTDTFDGLLHSPKTSIIYYGVEDNSE